MSADDGAPEHPPGGFAARIALRTPPRCADAELDLQYETVRFALQEYEDAVDPPLTVTLIRESAEVLGEEDLRAALFTCREALVDVLGVAADAADVTWCYAQRHAAEEAVVVEVRKGAPAPR